MKNFFAMLLVLFLVRAGWAAEFYVAPTGSDANPGTAAKPFATLEGARDAVRALKTQSGIPAAGVTVWIAGGDYYRSGTLTLSAQDSGQPGNATLPSGRRNWKHRKFALMRN